MKKFRMILIMASSVAFAGSRKHLLRLQLCLVFRGLSIRGIDVLGRIGIGPCARTMMRERDRMLKRAKSETSSKEFSVVWMDNYSKILACQKPRGQRTFNMNLWTVVVGKTHPHNDLPLLTAARMSSGDFCSKLSRWPSKKPMRWVTLIRNMPEKTDWSHALKVAVVPLKPDVRDVQELKSISEVERKQFQKALSNVVDGPRHLVPIDLLPWNVGSNQGLFSVMQHLYENKRVPPGNLQVIVSDCNIFARIVKVEKHLMDITTTKSLHTCKRHEGRRLVFHVDLFSCPLSAKCIISI